LIGWLACICLLILLSSRKPNTISRRTTGGPISSTSPFADPNDQ